MYLPISNYVFSSIFEYLAQLCIDMHIDIRKENSCNYIFNCYHVIPFVMNIQSIR